MIRRWMTAAVAVALATGVSVSTHAAMAPAAPAPRGPVPVAVASAAGRVPTGSAGSARVASARSTGLPGILPRELSEGAPGDGLPAPFAITTAGCVDPEPQMLTGRLPSGRTYLVHLPARYDPRRPYPVILAYHGRSQQARDIKGYSGLDRADALVLYPQGRRIPGPPGSTAWEGTRDLPADGKDVAFTRELLGVAGRAVCIDPEKVSAVGASQGGGFAAVLACTAPGTVSSIAAVAGAFYRPEAGGLRSCRSGPLRVLEFHGTADPVIDYNGTKRSRPIGAWLDEWARRDGCRGGPAVRPVPPDVTEFRWAGCAAGSEVLHYRVTHGNHGWPGASAASVAGGGVRTDTISATAIMLRFLQGQPVSPPYTADRPPAPLPALPVLPALPRPSPGTPGPPRPALPVLPALPRPSSAAAALPLHAALPAPHGPLAPVPHGPAPAVAPEVRTG